MSWLISRGAIPDGLEVRHTCHTPTCVNPQHLALGDAEGNARDMAISGRRLESRLERFGQNSPLGRQSVNASRIRFTPQVAPKWQARPSRPPKDRPQRQYGRSASSASDCAFVSRPVCDLSSANIRRPSRTIQRSGKPRA